MRWDGVTVEGRFWAKVDKRGPDECWEWRGTRQLQGYGNFYFGGRPMGAHRMSLTLAGVPIEGKVVCHHCNNPPCVNPRHLYAGTMADNVRDAIAIGKIVGPRPHTRGSKNFRAKLNEAQVADIFALSAKLTQMKLARQFKVTQSAITSILNRKTWKHVDTVHPKIDHRERPRQERPDQ